MGRLLILLLIGLLAAWWIFHRIGRLRHKKQPPKDGSATSGGGRASDGAQEMVACAHCGLHVPLKDAISQGELHFCGEPHRLLGPRP
jgi:uncharacterized protein